MLVGETQTFPDGSVRYSRVPHRRHEPLVAAVRGPDGARRPGGGRPHGFANPAIYGLAGGPALRDIKGRSPFPAVVRVNYDNGVDASDGTSVVLRSLDDEAQTLHLAPGWDNLTGVGSPVGSVYVKALGGR